MYVTLLLDDNYRYMFPFRQEGMFSSSKVVSDVDYHNLGRFLSGTGSCIGDLPYGVWLVPGVFSESDLSLTSLDPAELVHRFSYGVVVFLSSFYVLVPVSGSEIFLYDFESEILVFGSQSETSVVISS